MLETEFLAAYPQLTHDDVLAAITYGAEASQERIIPVPMEPAPVRSARLSGNRFGSGLHRA